MNKETIYKRLEQNEGVKQKAYHCTAGKITIGVGRNLDDVGLSEQEIRILLINDVKKVEEQVNSLGSWVNNLNDDRYYCLIDLVFQLGFNGFKKFKKTISYLAQGLYEQAGDELLDSNYARQTANRASRISNAIKTGVYKND